MKQVEINNDETLESWQKFTKDSLIVEIIKQMQKIYYAAFLSDALRYLLEKEKFMAKQKITGNEKFNIVKSQKVVTRWLWRSLFFPENNSYFGDTFQSFTVPWNNYTHIKMANADNICKNL